MTTVTGQFFMCLHKCEISFELVIELCVLPFIRVVTTGTIRAVTSCVHVIHLVTADALNSCGLIGLVGMTTGATCVCVSAG